jgi:hypothetical protein
LKSKAKEILEEIPEIDFHKNMYCPMVNFKGIEMTTIFLKQKLVGKKRELTEYGLEWNPKFTMDVDNKDMESSFPIRIIKWDSNDHDIVEKWIRKYNPL